MEGFLIFVFVVYSFGCACFSGALADAKGRNGVAWFVGGLAFGLPAVIAAAGMPTPTEERAMRDAQATLEEQGKLDREARRKARREWEG